MIRVATPPAPKGFRDLTDTGAARVPGPDRRRFPLEPWGDITFAGGEEWAIKRLLPRSGLAALYGRPGSLKSFVAVNIALCVALGWDWAGRRVNQAPVVYIAAEGSGGLRKRKEGYARAWPNLPASVPFYLVSAAPNLGADPGDLAPLIADIEAAGVRPGLIVLDTLAQTLGAADENGAGMTAFVGNAARLAAKFGALVLIVHHVGLGEGAQQRMRGHSSLHGALDAQLLCERQEGSLSATLTLQKLKDEACDVRLTANLSRVTVTHDDDGEEISTLIVETIADAAAPETSKRAPSVPRSQRLLREVIARSIDEAGEMIRPFIDGPSLRAVDEDRVRERYYAALAEQRDDDEDADKIAERRRKAFGRALKAMLDAKDIVAGAVAGRRMLWLH